MKQDEKIKETYEAGIALETEFVPDWFQKFIRELQKFQEQIELVFRNQEWVVIIAKNIPVEKYEKED